MEFSFFRHSNPDLDVDLSGFRDVAKTPISTAGAMSLCSVAPKSCSQSEDVDEVYEAWQAKTSPLADKQISSAAKPREPLQSLTNDAEVDQYHHVEQWLDKTNKYTDTPLTNSTSCYSATRSQQKNAHTSPYTTMAPAPKKLDFDTPGRMKASAAPVQLLQQALNNPPTAAAALPREPLDISTPAPYAASDEDSYSDEEDTPESAYNDSISYGTTITASPQTPGVSMANTPDDAANATPASDFEFTFSAMKLEDSFDPMMISPVPADIPVFASFAKTPATNILVHHRQLAPATPKSPAEEVLNILADANGGDDVAQELQFGQDAGDQQGGGQVDGGDDGYSSDEVDYYELGLPTPATGSTLTAMHMSPGIAEVIDAMLLTPVAPKDLYEEY